MALSGTVTILFTDLASSTEVIGRVGDDAGERFVVGHMRRLREVVPAHGGREIKKTGDGLMVAFNSAVAAVDCAIAMQQAIHWHNERDEGPPAGLRVGIHAGDAIPSEGDYYGVSVVVAKRLCDAADAGGIVVSDLVRALVGGRGSYRFTSAGSLELKGVEGSVSAYEVGWEPLDQLPSRERARVLIVDDNQANVLLLERILQQAGFTNLQSATDARQALPLYLSFRPDLVMLDLQMPHLDGFEVLEQISTRLAEDEYMPILVLTADITAEAKQRALSAGANDFLTKPFDPVEVVLRIRNLLDTRRLHLQLQSQNEQLEAKVRDRTQQLQRAELEMLQRLAYAAEFRDDATGEHAQRVGRNAALLARALEVPEAIVELYRRAATLHDVGKVAIPDEILLKPGKLSDDERAVVKDHTAIGARILAGGRTELLQLAEEIALTHHERWDGSGYSGLRGESIPLSGRIVAAVDVFDALVHERPYKSAWSLEDALAEMKDQSGRQLDPRVVDAFLLVQSVEDLVNPPPDELRLTH